MTIADVAEGAIEHRRLGIVLMLAVTAAFAVGATMVDETTAVDEFQTDSDEAAALEYVEGNFTAAENTTAAQVIVRDENALDRETQLEALEYQAALREDETVSETLVDEDPIVGIPNLVATAAVHRERAAELEARHAELNATEGELEAALERIEADEGDETVDGGANVETAFETANENTPVELTEEHYATFEEAAHALRAAEDESTAEEAYRLGTRGVLAEEYEALAEEQVELEGGIDPSLSEQREQLESMSEEEVEDVVASVLDTGDGTVLSLMPAGYEPGETEANATAMIVTQDTGGVPVSPDAAPEEISDAQFAMIDVAEDRDAASYVVYGNGITAAEIDASMADSMAVVGPLALLFVLVVLLIAYRDPLDVALGLFGIGVVLTWTFGFMGWTGIEFGQIFVAVPVLLIGLSIDYAIHVFMRGREARSGTDRGIDRAMAAGLAGVGLALVLVTVTTAAGFLSNLVSPMAPIREFGVVNAVGIVAALFVFGLLVPALKVEIDAALEARGRDRRKEAFGKTGRLEPVLGIGAVLARKAPVAVLAVVLLVSAGGVYGATQVDTSFDTDEFMAEDPPGWTEHLPDSIEPREYTAAETIDYLDDSFVRQEMETQIVVRGDPTDPDTLRGVDDGETRAATASTTAELPNGDAAVQGPLSTMEQVAATNESFNETYHGADTTGDGVPDDDLETVYDELFEADTEAAAAVVHRTEAGEGSSVDGSSPGGEYEALRIVAYADGEAMRGDVTEEMRAVADHIDDGGDERTATATGEQTVLYHIVEQEILDTVVGSLLLTLLSVGAFLTVISRFTAGSAALGVVTTLPVVLALSWVLGTMFLLGLSFNAITGMITSLTVGLGVAYSIHVSQRYYQQLDQGEPVWSALRTTVTGTGGALLGSAATTAGGFGVLAFSFMPSLQQFGYITAMAIVYAFLASVLVLPTLLVLWTRTFGPDRARERLERGAPAAERPREVGGDD